MKLPVTEILHVICRTLAVNPKMLVGVTAFLLLLALLAILERRISRTSQFIHIILKHTLIHTKVGLKYIYIMVNLILYKNKIRNTIHVPSNSHI